MGKTAPPVNPQSISTPSSTRISTTIWAPVLSFVLAIVILPWGSRLTDAKDPDFTSNEGLFRGIKEFKMILFAFKSPFQLPVWGLLRWVTLALKQKSRGSPWKRAPRLGSRR